MEATTAFLVFSSLEGAQRKNKQKSDSQLTEVVRCTVQSTGPYRMLHARKGNGGAKLRMYIVLV